MIYKISTLTHWQQYQTNLLIIHKKKKKQNCTQQNSKQNYKFKSKKIKQNKTATKQQIENDV